ncbi:ABC transporter permease [Caenispirillum bisanense]|uniref:Transport permease protein n=1 Tax=Caenispirillum bisanense TaxID=414052 RepID=A0A286GTA3_9PROT|nr:ABC transporter permease [Caenispirillum bisanense]SOD98775.1 lipopolysaccharide transport system permease protein [Caenispirillum bisanense]
MTPVHGKIRPRGAPRHELAMALVTRDVLGRYRGSAMGLTWTFVVPLLMLAIYTFVFGNIFKARWGGHGGDGSTLDFALLLFVGLILHSLLSEVLTRAPTIIVAHTNFVKRVVFPLDLLPAMTVFTALFHFFISFGVFLVFFAVVKETIHPTVLWLPVIVAPFALLLTGCAWFLAGAAVYYRDVGQIMGLAATVLLFLSPVFYPASMVPANLLPLFNLNPLTFIIEQARAVSFTGTAPDFIGLAIYTGVATVAALLGRASFQAMRKGFADVL